MGFFGFFKPDPGKMEKKGDIRGLLKALGNPEQEIRDQAGEALCRICTVQHKDLLEDKLSSEQWRVRAGVAIVLGCINDPAVVPMLLDLLKDPHAQVRASAAESLDKMNWIPGSEDERIRHKLASGDWYSLGDLGEEAIGPLTEALNWGDASVRAFVVMALGRIKSPRTVEVLGRTLLKDEDHNVRLNSALSLRDAGPEAIEVLVESLKDQIWEVRNTSAETLAQIGEASVEPLIKLLNSPIEYARSRAAYALGRIRDKRAVNPLITCLRDEAETVRWNAVKALGEIGAPEAIGPISVVLKDKIRSVQWQATLALMNYEKGIELLLEALESEDPAYRLQDIVAAMGDKAEKTAVDHVINMLDSEVTEIKWNSVVALGKIGNPKAVPHLVTMLRDRNPEMRGNIIIALGDIGSIDALNPLLDTLRDNDAKVRSLAANALAKIGDKGAVPYLIEALDDRDNNVKAEAARALGDLGDPKAIPLLEDLLSKSDEDIKYTVERAIEDLKRTKE